MHRTWSERSIRWFGGKSAALEAALLLTAAMIAASISAHHDLLERYVAWASNHEQYELDEVLILFVYTTIGAAVFAVRRLLDLRRQVALREASDAKARYLAYHDPLTGLANRAQFNDKLHTALARARENGSSVAILALDLDHFKHINDSLGHASGDALLRTVAERLCGSVRQSDVVGRLGGDEFAIIQIGQQPEAATALARRLTATCSEVYDIEGHGFYCGTSIGIALSPSDGTSAEMLLGAADAALYEAKREGRGTFRFFEAGMNEALQARRKLEQDMRRTLAEDGFSLHYQPLYELENGGLVGFEALLRWQHPERGSIPPAEFIPIAEETGLIIPLGEWVLRTACLEASGWRQPHKVAVNLSAAQFRQSNIVATVTGALADSGLAPERLEIEITESLLMQAADKTLEILFRLRALGVNVAMDDFGTGYSSLSYLWRFPFDKLKIDRSFVRDLNSDPKVSEIVRTIVSLGRTLNMTVTAEGIETAAQAEMLTDQGCDLGQGFFLGRPMPATAACALAKELEALPAGSWTTIHDPAELAEGESPLSNYLLATARRSDPAASGV